MITQRYKFYLAQLFLGFIIIISNGCNSTRLAQNDSEVNVRSTINEYVKAFNAEDIKMLENFYAEDFKSYAPIYEKSKKQLLEDIQAGFMKQDHQIQANITEITSGPTVATAHLQWMIIGENKEVTFAQNLLQVWQKHKTGWKLKRILFYAPN
jgi:ketosteroid isomerase-like protein